MVRLSREDARFPLAHDLEAHFDRCRPCRELFSSFEAVVSSLHTLEATPPPLGLDERIAARTRAELAAASRRAEPTTALAPAQWLAVAAVFALVLIWRPAFLTSMSQTATKTVRQTYSFGVRTYHQTERWIDDLNVLRMTVGVAFEDRLDKLNEQLQRFSENGSEGEDGETQSRGPDSEPSRADLELSNSSRSLL